jgi:transposase
MKVLIGVDSHKASVALAAVDEVGELIECASFPQNRAGLRALERWAKRLCERRWAVENAGGLGKHLSQRLAVAGESVVDVPPKLSARVRVLSSGNARKNDGLDALATALAAWRNERGWQRSIPRPGRKCCACFPRGASRGDRASVPEHSTACTDSCGISFPAGYRGHSRPSELPASCAAYDRRAPQPASACGWLRRSCATSGHWSERSQSSMGASKPR